MKRNWFNIIFTMFATRDCGKVGVYCWSQ